MRRSLYVGNCNDFSTLGDIVNLKVTRQASMLGFFERSYPCDFRPLIYRGGAQFAMVAGGDVVAWDVEEVGNRIVNGDEA